MRRKKQEEEIKESNNDRGNINGLHRMALDAGGTRCHSYNNANLYDYFVR
jgi:hypothetical protein